MSAPSAIASPTAAIPHGRAGDYLALTKPRIVLMVLVTTLAGFYLGTTGGGFDAALAINLMIGTALSAGGTLALNQYFERDTDAMMDRTRNRPLPAMKMRPTEALVFGAVATAAGLCWLLISANWLCAAVTAAITIVYLAIYTPLKRYTWMCNIAGAIPGALPPVAGWAAARGAAATEPFILFAIMFLWQLPHTFAVARMFRADFERAGIHILPKDAEGGGNPSNLVVIGACIGLIAAGAMPALLGYGGLPYLLTAIVLGAAMLSYGVAMVRAPGNQPAARRLLLASLVYLPAVLLALVLSRS
ncbi:MAG TPA: heme o synthase [Candidatus Binataceae bacterium]|nr:heme o synthase [Candidatus Binataceae bacterium]